MGAIRVAATVNLLGAEASPTSKTQLRATMPRISSSTVAVLS
jgi:hypothetical protein